MEKYLTAGYYTDADHPAILEFVDRFTANETNLKNKVMVMKAILSVTKTEVVTVFNITVEY